MNSKELGGFLECEKDKTILECQYCIVSTRIRLRSKDFTNVANFSAQLYPSSEVLFCDGDQFADTYYQHLENNKSLLAEIILISEKMNKNVIFLCTKNITDTVSHCLLLLLFETATS